MRAKVVSTLLLVTVLLVLSCLAVGCRKSRQLAGSWWAQDYCSGVVTLIFFEDGTGAISSLFEESVSFTWEVKPDFPWKAEGELVFHFYQDPARHTFLETNRCKFKVEKNALILYPGEGEEIGEGMFGKPLWKIGGIEINPPLVLLRTGTPGYSPHGGGFQDFSQQREFGSDWDEEEATLKAHLRVLNDAVTLAKNDSGLDDDYDWTINQLMSLEAPPGAVEWHGPYIAEEPRHPFGGRYVYNKSTGRFESRM